MKELFNYFFRSKQSAVFFVILHIMCIYGLYCIISTFDGQDPWMWLALYLVQGVLVLYYVASDKHRRRIVRMELGFRYPDIQYAKDGNVYWPGGSRISDLLTWIAAMRHVPRLEVLSDWKKLDGAYLRDRNKKDHELYLKGEFKP